MKPVVLIPTYNESLNIVSLLSSLENLRREMPFRVVVIDDNSPDGTANIVDNLDLDWVRVMRRTRKDGLGNAYRAAITEAIESNQFSHIVTMDSDGSHRVEDLHLMFASADKDELSVTLGTRWMPGGRVVNWPKYRQFLSKAGTAYARKVLGIPLRDLTGGFRIYSVAILKKLKINEMTANGYCFQIEMAMASDLAGAVFVEVPITFIERVNGLSKMSKNIVVEALVQTTLWGLNRALRPNADKLHYVK